MVRDIGRFEPVSRVLAAVLHHLDRPVSRLTHGRHTLTSLLTGLTVAVLTTTGARSGARREVPVLGFPAEGGFVVIASNYGRARHPGWYHNLQADPRAELLVHGIRRPVTAALTTGAQRDRLWQAGLAIYPAWAAYRARVPDREIGVFLLTPA
jgi:deazaflavin-dependent oxidoreductase (nitroreductase family)